MLPCYELCIIAAVELNLNMEASRFAGGRQQQFGGGQQQFGGGSPNQNRNSGGGGAGAGAPGGKGGAPTRPLRPATIHQVHSAQHVGDGALVIDGRECGQVTLVGRILSIDTNQDTGAARSFSYKISDGSGLITVRHWLIGGEGEQALDAGTTVRATGTVSHWQNQPILTGTVRPLISGDEITYHLLECILTHNRITKGPVRSKPAPQQSQQQGGYPMPSYAPPSNNPRIAVLSCLQNHRAGLTKDQISHALRGVVAEGAIQQNLREMCQDGTVFLDSNVYKA
jgi:hypothetical protein